MATEHGGIYGGIGRALAPAGTSVSWAQEAYQSLVAHARSRLPAEACGVLGGQAAGGALRVLRYLPLANAALGTDRFRAAPLDFARAENTLRQHGLATLGFAHSHPGGPAALSAVDRRELWRDCLQVVLALGDHDPPCALAFHLTPDGTALRLAMEVSR